MVKEMANRRNKRARRSKICSLRIATGRVRAGARVGRVASVLGRRQRANAPAALVEKAHTLLERTDLLRLSVLVHALPFEPTGATTLARAVSLRVTGGGRRCCRAALRPNDEVVELREDGRWERVNFELNLLRALRNKTRMSALRQVKSKITTKLTSLISGTPSWII
jgi:hypothetical protein